MNDQKMIRILFIVIILLLVVTVALFFISTSKEETILEFDDVTLEDGNPLNVVLTDSQGNPISGATVDFKIVDDVDVEDKFASTDSNGKAKLELGEGQYTIECSFEGDNKYKSASVVDVINVEEATTESVSSQRTDSYPEYSSDLGHYKSTGIGQDEMKVVELDDGRYVVIAGDGYYSYEGVDSQGNINRGSFLGHGGTRIG